MWWVRGRWQWWKSKTCRSHINSDVEGYNMLAANNIYGLLKYINKNNIIIVITTNMSNHITIINVIIRKRREKSYLNIKWVSVFCSRWWWTTILMMMRVTTMRTSRDAFTMSLHLAVGGLLNSRLIPPVILILRQRRHLSHPRPLQIVQLSMILELGENIFIILSRNEYFIWVERVCLTRV